MTRLPLILALAIALPHAAPVAAQGVFIPPPPGVVGKAAELTGKRKRVAHEMRTYGFNTDVARLSNRQIVLIDQAMHSGRSGGDTQSRIRSILSGGGVLQNLIDRF